MRCQTSLVLAMPITFVVASCGGGGGAPNNAPRPPLTNTAPPSPSISAPPEVIPAPSTKISTEDFNTQEYRASNAAVASNAIGAWQKGATGKGVTIGFVDTGLVITRTDFAGKVHTDSRDVDGDRPMNDVYGHGTAVAGIAAGAKDNSGMHGVAFDATILMAKADQGCPEHCTFTHGAIARGIDAARLAGAKVINLSVGGSSSAEIENAVRRAVEAEIVLVVGSGNSGPAPSEFAQHLAKLAPSNVIIVGALGSAASDSSPITYDVQSKYSAPAANSKHTYVAAPGLYNAATYFRSDGIDRLSGSSFAAPVVSGAIALLAQAFPTLSGQQLIKLIYLTADDIGAQGIDDIFGQGRLNIGRAFQPVGSIRTTGTDLPVRLTGGTAAPAAAGDAVYRNELRTIVLDDFDRAFSYNLASNFFATKAPSPLANIASNDQQQSVMSVNALKLAVTISRNSGANVTHLNSHLSASEEYSARLLATSVIARLSAQTSMAFGFKTGGDTLRDHMSPTGRSISLTMGTDRQHGIMSRNPRSVAVAHRWKNISMIATVEQGFVLKASGICEGNRYNSLSGAISYNGSVGLVSFALSQTREKNSLLGSNLLQMFGGGQSTSRYVDLGLTRLLADRFAVSANLRIGRNGTTAGTLWTRALSLEVSRSGVFNSNDQLMVNLAQPLRIESGQLSTDLPTSWDYITQTADINRVALNLTPSGRELQTEVGYARYFHTGSILMNAYVRRQPNHIANGTADVGLAVRGRVSF